MRVFWIRVNKTKYAPCITERYLSFGEDSLTLRLVSKLPDLRVANAKCTLDRSGANINAYGISFHIGCIHK